jgi:uracil-DNA glycosylase
MTFQDFLVKWFGKRIQELTIEKIDGLHFLPELIHQNYAPNLDKCQDCAARIFRQDIPFWLGSHKNKKLMVIAQDAGKGEEDYGLNTVFSIHNAHLNLNDYFNASHRHQGYYELFRDLIGTDDFLEKIYFTDIVKCAYSTGKIGSSDKMFCKEELFFEIDEVAPKALILMGKPAQSTFLKLSQDFKMGQKIIETFECQINQRSAIRFLHYELDNYKVFMIPHLIGNLHISKEFKSDFDLFKIKTIAYIRKQIS